uniref:Uncharacterized protein n=1 Tax=Anopheles albimanus TaxID=7167 RepID=A0A182FLS8_ANOAL
MEATTFVMAKLGIGAGDISCLRMKPAVSAIFVQLKEASLALRTVEQNDGKHSHECDGEQFPITISMVDNSVVVKLHDLTSDTADGMIADFFARFGEVRDCGRSLIRAQDCRMDIVM